MAHTRQAKKRIRQDVKRTATNRKRLSKIRTYVRRVEEAISAGDKQGALDALKAVQPELHKGARKRVLHRNTVARQLSRMSKHIKTLS